MNLPIPVPTVDPGPDYANNLNASLMTIDGHNHTAGSGVPITPAALNLNSDVTFQINNATNLRSARFASQGSPLSGASDLNCAYVSGVDLYYNDGNGNQIRITQGGSVAGATGTITGLPSGTAGAAYNSVSGTFVFTSASNIGANIDGALFLLRNNTANSKSLTLSPPAAMAANIGITFPTPPASAISFMTMDTSGNMGVSISTSGGIITSMIAAANITNSLMAASSVNASNIVANTITTNQISLTAGITPGQQNSLTSGSYTNSTNIASTTTSFTSGTATLICSTAVPSTFNPNRPIFFSFQDNNSNGSVTSGNGNLAITAGTTATFTFTQGVLTITTLYTIVYHNTSSATMVIPASSLLNWISLDYAVDNPILIGANLGLRVAVTGGGSVTVTSGTAFTAYQV